MLESLDELRTFQRVVDEGSLSAAARSLGVSVNAVSRRLAQLEGRLGVRLAERSTRRFALTDEGRRLLDRCRVILTQVDEAEEELRPTGAALRGTVRFAVHPAMITTGMMSDVAELLSKHKSLSVQVYARSVAVDPVAHGLDFAVCTGNISFQSVATRTLARVEWGLAAAPEYFQNRQAPEVPEDLETHECLRALRGVRETQWFLKNARGKQRSLPISGAFESDDTEALRAAVYGGVGIGFRPLGEIRREAAGGTLVHVLPGWTGSGSGVQVQLLSPPGRLRLARVRVVAEVVERAVHAACA